MKYFLIDKRFHVKHQKGTRHPMRIKIDFCPMFPLVIDCCDLKVVADFHEKYNRISKALDANPAILNAVHADIEMLGSSEGRESTFSSEQFLRMLIVKCMEGLSFRDVIIRVADSPIFRNFTRIFSGNIMNFTVLDAAFKMIKPSTWDKVNALYSKHSLDEGKITGEYLRIDSTVSETNIHYPTDASLLWDSYRVTVRLLCQLRKEGQGLTIGHRFHDKKVKRSYTFIATHFNKKTPATQREVRSHTKYLVKHVTGVRNIAQALLDESKKIPMGICASAILVELEKMIPLINHTITQAQRAFEGETVPAAERIFSIFEPHTELLKRGKAHKPNEFGHMVSIGQTKEKFISFYMVEEKSRHDIVIGDEAKKEHKKLFGAYPERFTADKNYYGGPEHTEKWESKIDVYSVGKKGNRTEEETEREHSFLFKLLQKFRAGCEGSISVLKRVFGLRRCLNRSFKSFASSIGCLVFCHNLVVMSRK
jgi:IS5 family transposase